MNKTKLFAAVVLSSIAVVAVGVAAAEPALTLNAAGCDHVGNHYSRLDNTETASGTKEYWVCCKCHEHYLSFPTGTWSDAGIASSVESSDDRYIPAYGNTEAMTQSLKDMGFGNVKTLADGTFQIGKLNLKAGVDTIIIPEGVTRIDGNTTFSSQLKWIVFPASLTAMPTKVVADTTKTKTFFCGSNNFGITKNSCIVINDGWEYVNGVPTSK